LDCQAYLSWGDCYCFDYIDVFFLTRFEQTNRLLPGTREFVLDGLQDVQTAFADHGLVANLRLETYDGERYFHVPPTSSNNNNTNKG
jgi:hypothetical protein